MGGYTRDPTLSGENEIAQNQPGSLIQARDFQIMIFHADPQGIQRVS
jgi:hypothetical protein